MQRILLIVLLGLLPLTAAADGKFYSRQTALAANVTIPDQRALIHFTNGVERLVIETRFTGAGTNFAWVVPLPSQPVVEAASTGLFPTLQYLFRPPITHDVPRYYITILVVMGVVLALRMIARHVSQPVVVILILFVCMFLAALLLPALSTAKSKAQATSDSANPSVSILDRQLVGVFETTTIASRNPQALQEWLRENGFVVTKNSEPVIADYVKDGWVFVAAKVRRDRAENQTSTPHPLSFTFKTERAVYPMRLTGVDNGPLQVELYVFGGQRAYAPYFKAERCAQPTYPTLNGGYVYRSPEVLSISHPLLRQWVDGSAVATKLTAALTPEQMRRDVWLDWRPFAEKSNRRFSHAGAATLALNSGAAILVAGLIAGYVVALMLRPGDPQFAKPAQLALVAAVAVGGLVYVAVPKIEVHLVRGAYSKTREAQYYPLMLVEDTSLEEARRILSNPTNSMSASDWKLSFMGGNWPNYYVGGVVHEEDSPGNFILRETNGRVEYVVFDPHGQEYVFSAWPVPKTK
jgi:hypothetical protein